MARQYSAKTFLRNTPNDLLEQYFTDRSIDLKFPWYRLGDTEVNPIFEAVEKLSTATRSSIDGDFAMVNDLACEAGTLAILERADCAGIDLAERFDAMKNAYERAMWTFLNEPDLFRLAGCFHEMDRRAGWKRRPVGVAIEAATDGESLHAFQDALSLFCRRQGRGRFCHVDHYLREDPVRRCYFAYPEDYASTELGFDDHGRFQQRARRAAFEIIFVYRPEEGVLELRAKGNRREKSQLEEMFGQHILGLPRLPESHDRPPFDLEVLKNRNFRFDTDPKDRVQSVCVRELTLGLPGDLRRRITIYAEASERAPRALHDLLDRAINKTQMPLDKLHPERARLRVTFEPENGRRPRSLTFEVGHPDRCTLRDDPRDQVCRKYLRRWGIANA